MKTTKLSLYGAIIGDFYGSYWEFKSDKPKNLDDALVLRSNCTFTDDTLMTLAIANAICRYRGVGTLKNYAIEDMRALGNRFNASYGCSFARWLASDDPRPYDSWGNGAPMRVSPAGLAAKSLADAAFRANQVTVVTHNHPFGMIWARIVAELVYLAKIGATKGELIHHLKTKHLKEYKDIFSKENDIEELHDWYEFTEASQDTAPQALRCFFESSSFADCLAKSLYIGGDSDTLSAISCSVAAPFYGDDEVKPFIKKLPQIHPNLQDILDSFQKRFLLR